MTRLGLQIPGFAYPGVADADLFEQVASIAVTAEESGFDSVWVMDHFEQLPMLGGVDEPILEGYTTLAALAARTSTVRLGTLVTGVTYRNPALLAKMVTSLDVISRGRAILGIGAAWFADEHEHYGFGPLPPAGERFERLEDALEICRAMFTEERASFEGRHHAVAEARNVPGPIQEGGPPIMIGGSGEKRTLRLVARYADMCNLFGGPEVLAHKISVLERHCAEVGRDPSEIAKTRLATVVTAPSEDEAAAKRDALLESMGATEEQMSAFAMFGGPDRLAEVAAANRDAGLDGIVVNLLDPWDLDAVAQTGEVLGSVFAGR